MQSKHGIIFVCVFLSAACTWFWQHNFEIGFFDASEFALLTVNGGMAHAPGYPLYLLLTRTLYFVFQEARLSQFVLSLLSYGMASLFFFKTFHGKDKQVDSPWWSWSLIVWAIFLTSRPVALSMAISEIFPLQVGLSCAIIYCVKRLLEVPEQKLSRYSFYISLLFALSFCNHHMAAFLFPPTLWLMLYRLKLKIFSLKYINAILAGLLTGALPLLCLLWPRHDLATFSYVSVNDVKTFFDVVLRRGYGSFNLSHFSAHESSRWSAFMFFVANTLLLKSHPLYFLQIVFATVLGLRESLSFKKIAGHYLLVPLSGLMLFFIFFLPNASLPLEARAYQHVLTRFMLFPFLFSLYPLAELLKLSKPKISGRLYVLLLAAVALLGLSTLGSLNLRQSTLAQEHLDMMDSVIFDVDKVLPDSDFYMPGYSKCVIFSRSDSLTFSMLYRFQTRKSDRKCFQLTPVSFSGFFRSPAERVLLGRYVFPENFPVLSSLESPQLQQHLLHSLKSLMSHGYKIYFPYLTDAQYFSAMGLPYVPRFNIFQAADGQNSPIDLKIIKSEFDEYLTRLEASLQRVSKPRYIEVIDESMQESLFYGLEEYAHYPFASEPELKVRVMAIKAEIKHKWPLLFNRQSFSTKDYRFNLPGGE